MTEFKQLDIYWIDLEPAKGAETKKLRPCVIVQGDLVNNADCCSSTAKS